MLQSTKDGIRQLMVVGDRVLIRPDEPEERTEVGLYLPQTVVAKEKVQCGRIVSVGPGIPVPDPGVEEEEPWKPSMKKHRFIPMQAREGDYTLFLKKSAIEIRFESEDYLVVPQAALLLLLRDLDKKAE